MRREIVPNVYVTDADSYPYNHGERLDTSKFKQFDKFPHENGYSDQEVRDKIGKNNGWAVCRSWSDIPNKKMCFEVLVNAKESDIRVVDYKAICNDYVWKSFTWSDDGQMIFPK